MDNLTHSLVGALIGQAGLKRKTGLAMPALIIGANLPDIDAACIVYGTESLAMRRGITHGPIAWVLLPLVLAASLWWFDRRQARRGTRPEGRAQVRFGWLYALALIACLTHPALDWLNVYGIRLLEPFSSKWFYGDTLFIIDVWLWALLGFATWFSLRRDRRGGEWQRPARAALAAAVAYIGLNWAVTWVSEQSLRVYGQVEGFEPAELVAISSPSPMAFWRRDPIFGVPNRWVTAGPEGLDGLAPVPLVGHPCEWPDTDELKQDRPDLAAFLFWSRAPFVERHPNGKGIVFQDARFYTRGVRVPFAVEFPNVECREPPWR